MDRPLNRPMITVSIMLATIMQTLDSTIANVALPHMQGTLSASQDQIAWVLTAYIVAAAIATPLTGWLCDRFGQKNIFLANPSVASRWLLALCGMSNSLAEIVAARLLQGVFGAALVPLAQVVLMEINPREKQGSAMAVWGMGVMVGPIIGPTLGGWLTDSYNWRWVFFINVPIGVIAIYGMWVYIRPDPPRRSQRFDAFGFATLSIAIASPANVAGPRRAERLVLLHRELGGAAILLVVSAGVYFIAHTVLTPAERSFVDYRLLKNGNYVFGLLFIFIVGLVLYATRALTPTMLESLLDYPVATAGLVTAPAGIGTMCSMLVAGRVVGRVDLRLTLMVGFGLTAFSLWQMSHYSLDLSQADIIWPGFIQGVGMGLVFVPLSAATFATLDPHMRAQGTSLYSLVRNVGSSLGISMVQTMLTRNTVIAHASLTERVTAASPAWNNAATVAAFNTHTPGGAGDMDGAVMQQAAMIAYIDDFWLMLILTVAVMPLLLLIKPPAHAAVPDEATAVVD